MKKPLTILLNKNVKMSKEGACAQAVHAALAYFNIDHGAVIVLRANKNRLDKCYLAIRDTEIKAGAIIAGIE